MLWLIVGLVVVVAITWLWRRGMEPAPNDLDTPEAVAMTFQYLLDYGLEGGEVAFQDKNDAKRRLTFVKYIRGRNDVGIRSRIYEPVKSSDRFDRLVQELSQRGVRYDIASSDLERRYVLLDYGADIGVADAVARLAIETLFDIRLEGCVAFFTNVLVSNSPRLTGVDKPAA